MYTHFNKLANPALATAEKRVVLIYYSALHIHFIEQDILKQLLFPLKNVPPL